MEARNSMAGHCAHCERRTYSAIFRRSLTSSTCRRRWEVPCVLIDVPAIGIHVCRRNDVQSVVVSKRYEENLQQGRSTDSQRVTRVAAIRDGAGRIRHRNLPPKNATPSRGWIGLRPGISQERRAGFQVRTSLSTISIQSIHKAGICMRTSETTHLSTLI
jgi:hypothetical protein